MAVPLSPLRDPCAGPTPGPMAAELEVCGVSDDEDAGVWPCCCGRVGPALTWPGAAAAAAPAPPAGGCVDASVRGEALDGVGSRGVRTCTEVVAPLRPCAGPSACPAPRGSTRFSRGGVSLSAPARSSARPARLRSASVRCAGSATVLPSRISSPRRPLPSPANKRCMPVPMASTGSPRWMTMRMASASGPRQSSSVAVLRPPYAGSTSMRARATASDSSAMVGFAPICCSARLTLPIGPKPQSTSVSSRAMDPGGSTTLGAKTYELGVVVRGSFGPATRICATWKRAAAPSQVACWPRQRASRVSFLDDSTLKLAHAGAQSSCSKAELCAATTVPAQ